MPVLLIVDDDSSIHGLIGAVLQNLELQIVNAYNGEEAIVLYKEHNPSLVLLDIDMPVMNGLQFLQHSDFTTSKECPLIVMSGLASNKEQQLCLDLGAEMFVGKPFQVVALKKTVQYYLERGQISQN
jgi:CheY-like chemotaxis protein